MTDTSTRGQEGQESAPDTAVGVYLYGIVPADVQVSDEARGVGEPSAAVTLVRHGEIGALVSELVLGRPLGTPDDLMAHERLLDATAAEVPVLPIRFGAVMTSSEAVVEELLAPHHDDFRTALEELEGRAEYVVKARYVERAVLAEVLEEQPEVARLREEVRSLPEDAGREARIQLGELVNQAVSAKREADTQELLEALAPVCVLTSVREPTHEQDAAHIALLVELDRQEDLEEVLDRFAEQWEGRVQMRLLGPLAPYDFIVTPAG
ncbi:GvpL/GvpF family gas vesicle protein [Nonomuraea rhodomycinica]|uniref:GvpL/GvpF family gas vesicle protein n=1 Tax=Nonomuraea rhodomycinica TaxID=1712872 RepID=A0A7Y6IS94_9ACTN|nr:GvpL/GvpF family gas vesicle protein [Nonomuraea rhodomycinica]NUW43123.1 GvpL/GvpF family gas vesicle protein [Nonomuraea rhodomycinica]